MTRPETELAWAALEAETGHDGQVSRRLLPSSGHDLHARLDLADRSRTLRYTCPWTGDPPTQLPQSQAVRTRAGISGGVLRVDVTLTDPLFASPFTSLANDVAGATASATSHDAALTALLTRLEHWQELLARLRENGMDPQQRRGLFGELHTLHTHVLPHTAPATAIRGWTGPQRANQDVQLDSCAIEVKTTSGQQPQALVVANERELDDTGTGLLLLLHLSLDERRGGTGSSLNEAADLIDQQLSGRPEVRSEYRDRLEQAGYLPHQRHLYDEPRYEPRGESCFQVGDGFPRITESQLAPGVGAVRYSITLAACQPHAVAIDRLHQAVRDQNGPGA